MREAIAGMYGSVYIHNLLILLCYVPIALFNRTGNKTSSGRTEPPVRPEAV